MLQAVARADVESADGGHELDERQVSIVLIGNFNPRIVQPSWFDARGLLTEADVEADNLLVSEAITTFRTPLLTLLCDQGRFQITTTGKTPTPDLIRDLVVDTFEILGETPIGQIGINELVHVPSRRKSWDALVAQFGDPQRSLEVMDEQQLKTIELTGPRPDEDPVGSRQVLMQPSVLLQDGVFIQINDHLRLDADGSPTEARTAVEILANEWGASREFADKTIQRLAPDR